jgi:hypothetical protein
MAFDLVGAQPKNYDGEWVRFNIWTWHRIYKALCQEFPEEDVVKLWYVNNDEFVDEDTCVRWADKIERYGTDRFSQTASKLDLPVQQTNIGERTLYMSLVFEMPAFVSFLRNCNGFYIK